MIVCQPPAFFGIKNTLYIDTDKAVIGRLRVILCSGKVTLQCVNQFLLHGDLLREMLDDIILQSIDLREVAGFQKSEPLHLNAQVHLLFDVGVAGRRHFVPAICWS